MSISYINNGESGASVRATLNALIDIVNYYSSSVFTGSVGPQPVTFTVYDESPTTAIGVSTQEGACTAYTNGTYSHSVYVVKGGGNSSQTQIEVGDTLYTDAGLTQTPSMGQWFGYFNSMMMGAYSVQIGAGGSIMSSNVCSAGPSILTAMIYDTAASPAVYSGTDTSSDACNAISNGTSHTLWFTKGAGNTGTGIEVGDNLYSNSELTQPLPSTKWFGYYDGIQMANKSFQVSAGSTVQSIESCVAASSALLYSSTPATLNPFVTGPDACNGITNAYTQTVYITKDPANMDPNNIEVNDILYTDSGKTTTVASGWYGYTYTAINYSVEVGAMGVVTNKFNC